MKNKIHQQYSSLVVLVCNVSSEIRLTNTYKALISALKNEWAEKQNDPECNRMDIIYLHGIEDRDGINVKYPQKFEPLTRVDNKSKIIIRLIDQKL